MSRPDGPLSMRFFLQPFMAICLAIRAGLRDARAGDPPFLFGVVTDPAHRRALVRSAWMDTSKVFFIAMALDVVFQLIALKTIRPLEAVTIAFVLAILPYSLVRGPANRLASRHHHRMWRDP